MINPKLRELLEVDNYKDVLVSAVFHYKERLQGLEKLEKLKDFMPYTISGEFRNGDIIISDFKTLDVLENGSSDEILNIMGNSETLVDIIKDAVYRGS